MDANSVKTATDAELVFNDGTEARKELCRRRIDKAATLQEEIDAIKEMLGL